MIYADRILVRLADPATRAAVFDAEALEQLVNAAYDAADLNLQGPFNPLFDQFRVGLAAPRMGNVDAAWGVAGGAERHEGRFQVSGIGTGPDIPVDAYWRGAIVARTATAAGTIDSVRSTWPSLAGIDEEIVAALGALPADPAVLEQERRTRLIARIRTGFSQPAAFTARDFDEWLGSTGASSVSDLLARFQGAVQPGALQIHFLPGQAPPPAPRPLAVAVALLIRDAGFSLADLIQESRRVRDQLEPLGLCRPSPADVRLKEPLLVGWVIPAAVFADNDWPGANASARRANAGVWLAREGIGLVVTA